MLIATITVLERYTRRVSHLKKNRLRTNKSHTETLPQTQTYVKGVHHSQLRHEFWETGNKFRVRSAPTLLNEIIAVDAVKSARKIEIEFMNKIF